MKVDVTVKDLLKIVMVLILVVVLLGAYTIYKDVRHDAAIKLAQILNTMDIFGNNFNAIQNWKESVEGRLQRIELAAQISGNVVESGALDDQGNPIKK